MKKLIAVALAACVIAALLVIPASGAVTVRVKDNFFSPKTLTVSKGTTVTWRWRGRAPHNVTVTKGPVKFHSATKTSGTYSKRIRTRGTYRIVCTIHAGMRMTLTAK